MLAPASSYLEVIAVASRLPQDHVVASKHTPTIRVPTFRETAINVADWPEYGKDGYTDADMLVDDVEGERTWSFVFVSVGCVVFGRTTWSVHTHGLVEKRTDMRAARTSQCSVTQQTGLARRKAGGMSRL